MCCPSRFKFKPSFLSKSSNRILPQYMKGLYVRTNSKFCFLLITFIRYVFTSLISDSVSILSCGLGIIADIIILMLGFFRLQTATRFPKSDKIAWNGVLLPMSLVPTWKITMSKLSSTASGALPSLLPSLSVNWDIVSLGNACTRHPWIPETSLAIESQIIVTRLTFPISVNINCGTAFL